MRGWLELWELGLYLLGVVLKDLFLGLLLAFQLVLVLELLLHVNGTTGTTRGWTWG